MLLESRVLGHGASGRNGGQVLHDVNGVAPETPEMLRRIHARDAAGHRHRRAARRAATRRREPFAAAAVSSSTPIRSRADDAQARVESRNAAGIAAAVRAARARSGSGRVRRRARSARRASQRLRAAPGDAGRAARGGRRVYENTPVATRASGRRGRPRRYARRAPRARRRARDQRATRRHSASSAAASCRSTRTCSRPRRSRRRRWSRIGWGAWDGFSDDFDRIAYACRTPGGRLLFGGGGNAGLHVPLRGRRARSTRARATRAEHFLRASMARYFPALADAAIAHRWAGTLAITLDRVCSMGVGGEHRNVYHALGYSGHGVALALLAGRVLADLYDDNHEAVARPALLPEAPAAAAARTAALARLSGLHAPRRAARRGGAPRPPSRGLFRARVAAAVRTAIAVGSASSGRSADFEPVAAFTVEAEKLGVDAAWSAEAWGRTPSPRSDSWRRARAGSCSVPASCRSARARRSMTAMTALTLAAALKGRFLLGLGAAGRRWWRGSTALPSRQPLERMRETVEIVRLALRGEKLAYDGRRHSAPASRRRGQGPAPRAQRRSRAFRSTSRRSAPKALELTGELADGWLGTSFTPEHAEAHLGYLRRGAERAGRKLADIDARRRRTRSASATTSSACWPRRSRGWRSALGAMGSPRTNFYNDAYAPRRLCRRRAAPRSSSSGSTASARRPRRASPTR